MKNDSEENKTTETAVTRLDELERQHVVRRAGMMDEWMAVWRKEGRVVVVVE